MLYLLIGVTKNRNTGLKLRQFSFNHVAYTKIQALTLTPTLHLFYTLIGVRNPNPTLFYFIGHPRLEEDTERDYYILLPNKLTLIPINFFLPLYALILATYG